MNIPIIVSENRKYLYKTTKLRLNRIADFN